MEKFISPDAHCTIDYGLSSALAVVPALIGANDNAIKMYGALATTLTAYNALTDTKVAVKPVISFKTHMKADLVNLAGIYALGFTKPIRKQRNVLAFHVAFATLATLNVLFTNPDQS